jgi:hypothetical protein
MAGSVRVEGLNRAVRDLQRAGLEVGDLKDAFGKIARLGASVATGFAPRRTGRLAGNIRPNKARNSARIVAGGARVPYAGVINYGWPARGIAASGFMQRADESIGDEAPDLLIRNINRIIEQRGLS